MTPEQTRRRNQIQHVVDDNRPLATWIIQQMTDKESATFDAAFLKGGQSGKQAVGQILVRVGREMSAKQDTIH